MTAQERGGPDGMTGAEALARYREQQAEQEEARARKLRARADEETRRKLDYISRQLNRPREPQDHQLLRTTRREILARLERT